jgi:hypothetical protein
VLTIVHGSEVHVVTDAPNRIVLVQAALRISQMLTKAADACTGKFVFLNRMLVHFLVAAVVVSRGFPHYLAAQPVISGSLLVGIRLIVRYDFGAESAVAVGVVTFELGGQHLREVITLGRAAATADF